MAVDGGFLSNNVLVPYLFCKYSTRIIIQQLFFLVGFDYVLVHHLSVCGKADLPIEVGLTMYCTRIRPLLEYALPIWGGLPGYLGKLECIQKRSLAIVDVENSACKKLSIRQDVATECKLVQN